MHLILVFDIIPVKLSTTFAELHLLGDYWVQYFLPNLLYCFGSEWTH
jgi:hypothetical protein